MQEMFCSSCGAQLMLNASFCNQCGAPIAIDGLHRVPQSAPQYVAHPQAEEKQLDVVSLVLSIIGLAFSLLIPPIALVCSIVGLVFALSCRKDKKVTAAIVMSLIGIVIALALIGLSAAMIWVSYKISYDYSMLIITAIAAP